MRALAKLGPGPDALALTDRDAPTARAGHVVIEIAGAVSQRPGSWRRALALIATGAVPSEILERIVTARFPLDRWSEAFDAAAGRGEGKVVIVPSAVAANTG